MSWLRGVHDAARELLRGLGHLVFPPLCTLCLRSLPSSSKPFCDPCHSELLADPTESCPRCALTVGPFGVVDGRCPNCRKESFAFEASLRMGPYEGLRRDAVLRIKRHAGEALAELLGETWAERDRERFLSYGIDVVIPVPLHWWRRWQRGYNQSEALARGLCASLKLSCQPSWLRRVRFTSSQTMQSAEGRRDNVRGAFRAGRATKLKGLKILLVDDVMTTGNTASEAARALRAAGAKAVVVACLSRASQ